MAGRILSARRQQRIISLHRRDNFKIINALGVRPLPCMFFQ